MTSREQLTYKISVVVPARDEANTIGTLLDGLLHQTLLPDEIVITDGGSVDHTRAIVQGFIEGGAPVKLLHGGHSLPGRGRNIGVANAKNDWIAFIDAGIKPAPIWLEALAEKAGNRADIDVVYGMYEPIVDTFFEECAAFAYVSPAMLTGEGPVRPPSIASCLIRRQVCDQVGGFPEDLRSAEDLVFINRVEAAGFRIVRAPAAVVHWTIQPGLLKTFKRFVVYARNNIQAGLWWNWQRQIFMRYGALALSVLPAIFLGAKWLVVPIGLWIGLMTARSLRALYQNRRHYPAGLARNLFRLIVIVPILSAIDLATFVGSAAWLFRDWPKADSHDSRK
jgi:glycosyltransferase involved in cell wall biosynthesis